MARDDEFTHRPPRRRRRDGDEGDYADRPRRRRPDEDYEEPEHIDRSSGLDGFFLNTSMIMLIVLSVCCTPIALILGILGLVLCKDADAKQNALVVTIVSGVLTALGFVMSAADLLTNR